MAGKPRPFRSDDERWPRGQLHNAMSTHFRRAGLGPVSAQRIAPQTRFRDVELADEMEPRRHRSAPILIAWQSGSGMVGRLPIPQVFSQSNLLALKRGDALLRCCVRHSRFDAAVPTNPRSWKFFHEASCSSDAPRQRGRTAARTIRINLAVATRTSCTVLHTPAVRPSNRRAQSKRRSRT